VVATPGDGDHRLRNENSHYQGNGVGERVGHGLIMTAVAVYR
jgi:hypothetical protein